MALAHAKQLRVNDYRRPLLLWIECLQLGLQALDAGQPLVFRPAALPSRPTGKWSKHDFERFSEWHADVVAPHLLREARRRDLIALSLDYVGAAKHHPSPELKFVRVRAAATVSLPAVLAETPGAPAPSASVPEEEAEEPAAETDLVASVERAREDGFVTRFGFDAPPGVRAQVLRLKADNQFTDREIRWLRRSGSLPIRGDRVVCKPCPWMPALGMLLLAPMCLAIAHAVMAFYLIPSSHLLGSVKILGVLLCYLAIAWLIVRTLISPFFFLRRRLARRSDASGDAPNKASPPLPAIDPD